MKRFAQRVSDEQIRNALLEYVDYLARFNVVIMLRKKAPHFRKLFPIPHGHRFHVILRRGVMRPATALEPNDDVLGLYESQDAAPLEELERLVKRGLAKFVRIDEKADDSSDEKADRIRAIKNAMIRAKRMPTIGAMKKAIIRAIRMATIPSDEKGGSVLSRIEAFAHHPEGVTFLLHTADERQYLFCIFGEKVQKKEFGGIAKVVTQYQQKYFGRGTGGRPPDLDRRARAHGLLSKPGSLKEKAGQLDATNISSGQVYTSRVKKSVR